MPASFDFPGKLSILPRCVEKFNTKGAEVTGLSVSVSQSENALLLEFQGTVRVDTAELLQQHLANSTPIPDLTVDWEHAEYVDASVLQVLLASRGMMKPGCVLRVVRDNPKIRHYLDLSGLSEFFPCAALE